MAFPKGANRCKERIYLMSNPEPVIQGDYEVINTSDLPDVKAFTCRKKLPCAAHPPVNELPDITTVESPS